MKEEKKKTPKYISKAMRRLARIGHKKMKPEARKKRARNAVKARWEKYRKEIETL